MAGIRWMNRIARELSEATGLTIKRQLLEVREGNLGDIELHERLPLVLEAKNEEDPSVWSALEQANEVAEGRGLYPVAVLQRRSGVGPIPHERVVGWWADDWKEFAGALAEKAIMRPVVSVNKTGKTYPRVWDGLEEAAAEIEEPHQPNNAMPICFGLREEGKDVLLQQYEDFLWMVGVAVTSELW